MPKTIPDRSELHALFDEQVAKLNLKRDTIDLTKGFYAKTGNAVFEGGYLAISDACRGTNSRIHTVAAPVGAGKTTFSYALMTALTEYAEAHPESPYGCALVCDQIEKADLAFRELSELMPGKVWANGSSRKGGDQPFGSRKSAESRASRNSSWLYTAFV